MSSIQTPDSSPTKRPGHRAVVVGAVLVVASIAVGMVGAVLTIGRLDEGQLTRDVVISGAPQPKVPGRLKFEVLDSVSGSADSKMHVAVAVGYEQLPTPTCTMETTSGRSVTLSRPAPETRLLRSDIANMTLLGSARLNPGSYEVVCARPDGADGDDATFTVGRAVGMSDLTGDLAPVLWFMGVGLVALVLFVSGAVTLTVGLVRRSRAARNQPPAGPPFQPPGPYTPPGPGQHPQPYDHPPTYPPSYPEQPRYPPPYGGPGSDQDPPETTGDVSEPTGAPPSKGGPDQPPTGWTVPPSKK